MTMSIDGHLLRLAREKLAVIKETNEFEQSEHKRIAYAKNPEIRRLDEEITRTMFALLSKVKGAEGVRMVREKSRALTAELKSVLKASGFPEDYLDIHYSCEKCSDTGYHGTQMCSCLRELCRQEQAKRRCKKFFHASHTPPPSAGQPAAFSGEVPLCSLCTA